MTGRTLHLKNNCRSVNGADEVDTHCVTANLTICDLKKKTEMKTNAEIRFVPLFFDVQMCSEMGLCGGHLLHRVAMGHVVKCRRRRFVC